MTKKNEWCVVLSDGRKISKAIGDPGAWREVINLVRSNNLKIKSFKVFEQEICDNQSIVSCFIINDLMIRGVLSRRNRIGRARQGFGVIKANGKAYINWITIVGNEEVNNYREVIPKEKNNYHEISIEIERLQE